MDEDDNYPIKTLFTLFCFFVFGLLSFVSDNSLYEKTKPMPDKITKFDDSEYVRLKISMGCKIDTEFENNKREQRNKQQNIQKYIIMFLNFIITFVSILKKNIGQMHSFNGISWMIGALSDSSKSILYYTYVKEYLDFCEYLEKHNFKTENPVATVELLDKVVFENTSFGYFDDSLLKNPNKIQKIFNLSYTFYRGKFYYLEAPNGIGKSTILKMFSSNLFDGDIYFNSTNRKHFTFEDINSSIFHIVQASEYTPKFSKNELSSYKGRCMYLETQLGLKDLLEKDTVEMSGGQKKRILIYIALTSHCPIVLLDEVLSELSTEETGEVPEGGGWLTRVINTIINWEGRKNKIMLLVGHGLRELIPREKNVIVLKMSNTNNSTMLH
jgi:ABC-type cobalamin/Fe3+-siderophores transport system ATPase subunit